MGDLTLAMVAMDGGVVGERNCKTAGERVDNQVADAGGRGRSNVRCLLSELPTYALSPAAESYRDRRGGAGERASSNVSSLAIVFSFIATYNSLCRGKTRLFYSDDPLIAPQSATTTTSTSATANARPLVFRPEQATDVGVDGDPDQAELPDHPGFSRCSRPLLLHPTPNPFLHPPACAISP